MPWKTVLLSPSCVFTLGRCGCVTLPPAPTGKLIISLHKPTCSTATNILKFVWMDLWAVVLSMASLQQITNFSLSSCPSLHRHSLCPAVFTFAVVTFANTLCLCFSQNPPAAYRQASREQDCEDTILTHKQELCEAATLSQRRVHGQDLGTLEWQMLRISQPPFRDLTLRFRITSETSSWPKQGSSWWLHHLEGTNVGTSNLHMGAE